MHPFQRCSDQFVAGGCIRPSVLIQALRSYEPHWRCGLNGVIPISSGLVLEPLAWLQAALYAKRLAQIQPPDDPVVVIGHWRSGTTYLHQLLASDPAAATARNAFTVAPQVALVLKPLIAGFLNRIMSAHRPIDAVPWSALDPQEDELGLVRLTLDTNMAGVAFPCCYPRCFRRYVLASTASFRRELVRFTKLTWLHDGAGKSHLVIKNSAHTARVLLLLQLYPNARFVLLKRDPIASIRSLVQVKQLLGGLMGFQAVPDQVRQVEETVAAHAELMGAFEASRAQIPPGQLVEVAYTDLIASPITTVERIYRELGIGGWQRARSSVRACAARAENYHPSPVKLNPAAEQRLQELIAQQPPHP